MGSKFSKEEDYNGLILSEILLPTEIVEHILNFLNPYEKIVPKYVCKLWSKLIHIQKRDKIDFMLYHANNGHDKIIVWLMEHKYSCSKNIYRAIIHNNCTMALEIIINDSKCNKIKKKCTDIAIRENNLEALKIIYESVYDFDDDVCEKAARLGQFEILEWLYRKGYKLSLRYYRDFAKQGRFDILKFLIENDGDIIMDWRVYIGAAEGGHLEILKWLKSHGCYFDCCIYAYAARSGNLEMVKWLKENNIKYPQQKLLLFDDPVSCAICYNHFEIFIWLYNEGFVLDTEKYKTIISEKKMAHDTKQKYFNYL